MYATYSHQEVQLKNQGVLFEYECELDESQSLITTTRLSTKQATFKGGLASAIHRWFRLTPSYSPELVTRCLEDMGSTPGMTVLDPFSGAGTTPIQAKLAGYQAFGFEINPLLAFVCATCIEWGLSVSELNEELAEIRGRFISNQSDIERESLETLGYELPPIHNIHRWWRDDILRDLMALLRAIRCSTRSEAYIHFFELALIGILVPDLTNVTLGRLQLFFVDKSTADISVWRSFASHAKAMTADIQEISELDIRGTAKIFHVNSTELPNFQESLPKIDRVITSPPYPNRYSYVWNTRPHLYLLGLITEASEASAIDKKAIGGTWGTATSALQNGVVEAKYPVIESVIGPIAKALREQDNLMANYVMHYFNQLALQITQQHKLLNEGAELAYVVGCSRSKGIFIETDALLAKIFEGLDLGYSVRGIERFRKRHSGKDLHESTVYVQLK